SGLLATVARAGAGLRPDITVIDRCQTPLELCRRFAAQWSLPVHAKRMDLTELDLEDFDVIYANSVLQFIPAERRVDVLARMKRALRPGGHLVCVFNAGGRIEGAVVPEYRGGYAEWLLAELERSGIALPDTRETIRRRTNDYTHDLQTREGAFAEP